MPLHAYWFFLSSVYIWLVLTFDIFNIKILIIYIKKTHELLKVEHLRVRLVHYIGNYIEIRIGIQGIQDVVI